MGITTLAPLLARTDTAWMNRDGAGHMDAPSHSAVSSHRETVGAPSTSLEGHLETLSIQDEGDQESVKVPTGAISAAATPEDITYRTYADEDDIPVIMALIAPHLSEPYSVYCYRYFLHGWPRLCILAHHGKAPIGVIVCKQDIHRGNLNRGYIAMLATEPGDRKLGIASTLVQKCIKTMKENGAQEVRPPLESLFFVKETKRHHRLPTGLCTDPTSSLR